MLRTLHIENYALISHSDITFEDGFVAITGETGAGKSILLGALGLLLGARADGGALYDPQRKCVVEAAFDIGGLDLQEFFAQHDMDYDDTLLLRRELLPSGKSRAFANDTPVPLAVLKELGTRLVDIHSQHQTLTMGNSTFQQGLLDSLADTSPMAEGGNAVLQAYGAAYKEFIARKHRLGQLVEQEAQGKRDLDYNQFLYDELERARLVDGEQQQLEEEQELMSHTEGIKQGLAEAIALGDGDDGGALGALTSARQQLSRIGGYHKDVEGLHQRLETTLIELRDLFDEARRIDDDLSFSPQRQQEVEERLDLIYRLEKKHGVSSVGDLLRVQATLQSAIEAAGTLGEDIRRAAAAMEKACATMMARAERLSAQRQRSARVMEQALLPTLAALGMKEARLKVRMDRTEECGPTGCDAITFLFNANQGGTFRELSKVASGGEMSRLMLAIKSMVVQQKLLPTILFDEIDSGVSGDTAVRVGHIMENMAAHTQVIAITHLPQIAARATQHLFVHKEVADGRTASHISPLATEERMRHIAVMLSSDPPTEAALQTARELMERKTSKPQQ